MAKTIKQRKRLDRKSNLSQENPVTEQASSWDEAAFLMKSNHDLDPDGDLVLILNLFSFGYKNAVHDARSEGRVSINRPEVIHNFD